MSYIAFPKQLLHYFFTLCLFKNRILVLCWLHWGIL